MQEKSLNVTPPCSIPGIQMYRVFGRQTFCLFAFHFEILCSAGALSNAHRSYKEPFHFFKRVLDETLHIHYTFSILKDGQGTFFRLYEN